MNLELNEKLAAIDNNLKELWDEIDDNQQKDLQKSLFVLNRFVSNVTKKLNSKKSSITREEQEHWILSVNEFYNKNFFTLQKHPKLLWQLLCMCSYDNNTIYYHEWLGFSGKKINNKIVEFLKEQNPTAKLSDIEIMSKILTKSEIKALAESLGYEPTEIKKLIN